MVFFFCRREQSKSRILSVNWKSRVLLYELKLLVDSLVYTISPPLLRAAMNKPLLYFFFFFFSGLIEKKVSISYRIHENVIRSVSSFNPVKCVQKR